MAVREWRTQLKRRFWKSKKVCGLFRVQVLYEDFAFQKKQARSDEDLGLGMVHRSFVVLQFRSSWPILVSTSFLFELGGSRKTYLSVTSRRCYRDVVFSSEPYWFQPAKKKRAFVPVTFCNDNFNKTFWVALPLQTFVHNWWLNKFIFGPVMIPLRLSSGSSLVHDTLDM